MIMGVKALQATMAEALAALNLSLLALPGRCAGELSRMQADGAALASMLSDDEAGADADMTGSAAVSTLAAWLSTTRVQMEPAVSGLTAMLEQSTTGTTSLAEAASGARTQIEAAVTDLNSLLRLSDDLTKSLDEIRFNTQAVVQSVAQANTDSTAELESLSDDATTLQEESQASFKEVGTDMGDAFAEPLASLQEMEEGSVELNEEVSAASEEMSAATTDVMAEAESLKAEAEAVVNEAQAKVEGAQAQVLESGTLSYQWERFRAGRWAAVSGAADLQLSLSPVRPTDAGRYRLVVENARCVSASFRRHIRDVNNMFNITLLASHSMNAKCNTHSINLFYNTLLQIRMI
jgi:hypothetical protein